MTEKHFRVLSLLATGIAIELILAVAMLVGRGHSEQWLSTKYNQNAVGDNSITGSNQPGEILSLGPEGAPFVDDEHGTGAVPDFANEPTPVFQDFGVPTPGGGLPDDGFFGSGGYPPPAGPDNPYPAPGIGPYDPDYGPEWPTQPPGPGEIFPTDVPAAPGLPTSTNPPPFEPTQAVTSTPPAQVTNTLPAPTAVPPSPTTPPDARQPSPTVVASPTASQVPTGQPTNPAQPTATAQPTRAPSATPVPEQFTGLLSIRTGSPPSVDGQGGDAAWKDAPAVTINTSGGANASATRVTVQSVHDGKYVYFLLRWADASQSYLLHPWEKQPDGTWLRLSNPGSGADDENTYYEDKLAFFWPIQASSAFNSRGCGAACHTGGNAGMSTGSGEVYDLWQWKSVRNSGQVDDQYMDDAKGGFHADPDSGGGYSNNQTKDQRQPAYMPPGGGDKNGWPGFITDAQKAALDSSLFKSGERVPSIITAPWQGDRGNIQASWTRADGQWVLELRRKLVTGSSRDVQFDDPGRVYSFALATFDNSQLRHAVQDGATLFRLGP